MRVLEAYPEDSEETWEALVIFPVVAEYSDSYDQFDHVEYAKEGEDTIHSRFWDLAVFKKVLRCMLAVLRKLSETANLECDQWESFCEGLGRQLRYVGKFIVFWTGKKNIRFGRDRG